MHFSTIKASDLVLIEKVKIEEMKKNQIVDPTAINIHGTIHKKVPKCKMYTSCSFKICYCAIILKDPNISSYRSKFYAFL